MFEGLFVVVLNVRELMDEEYPVTLSCNVECIFLLVFLSVFNCVENLLCCIMKFIMFMI